MKGESYTPEEILKHLRDLTGERDQLNRRVEELLRDNARMRELLGWLDRRGGLGLDVHERIRVVAFKAPGKDWTKV